MFYLVLRALTLLICLCVQFFVVFSVGGWVGGYTAWRVCNFLTAFKRKGQANILIFFDMVEPVTLLKYLQVIISLVVLSVWHKSHYYTLLVICLDISSRDELIWFCLLWCVVLHAFRVYWYAFVSRSEGVSVCMLYNCKWNSPAFCVRLRVPMSLQVSCPIFSFLSSTVFMYCDSMCADVTSSVLSYLFFFEQHCIHVLWLLCVLMSLQASCPIFSFLSSTVFMYCDSCVCWCHFKRLVLSFLFWAALYSCTVTLCVLMSLQVSCPIFSFLSSTVFMYCDSVCADVTSSVLSYLFFFEQHCIHVLWLYVCWCHFKHLVLSFLIWSSTVFMYCDFIFHRTRLPLSCLWRCWSSSVAVCRIASLPALLSVR